MYVISADKKRDPVRRWHLPDRVFFAADACHILAFAFLEKYADRGYRPVWIKPGRGFTGNHIAAARGNEAFDYHGFSRLSGLLRHIERKAAMWWPGWHYELKELPVSVLVNEAESRRFPGLRLREPTQYLHDALPRAHAFLNRFPAPTHAPAT